MSNEIQKPEKEWVMPFGKYKGKTFLQILEESPSYIIWLSEKNIVEVPGTILSIASKDNIYPDFEDLHPDWGCRD